ncbi:phage portal protein [Clostridium scatologenes]|uniref:SPP1 family phage portal protein n=1 Tax=Clostridium scatologenes TaxID=1548 RepID=A0A0E3M6Q3_CLOSL|nr:phage portal protein [Clostridium scatologenes]AKA69847.1 SPP1 family phage portal protein [Clostridium scatologenes]
MLFDFKPKVSAMSREEIIKQFIDEFDKSSKRKNMLIGQAYYENRNDINCREIYCYVNKQKIVDHTKVNNKLSHAFMKLLVDEKIGYLLGKSPVYTSLNDKFQKKVNEILDEDFDDILNESGIEASNKGISYLQVYIDDSEKLRFKLIPSEQVVPIWDDTDHSKLQSVIRYYYVTVYEGKNKKDVLKVEYWDDKTVMYYTDYNGRLIPDVEANETTEPLGHYLKDEDHYGWGRVPFIVVKNNNKELSDLTFVKYLIDDYDLNTSDISNNIAELQSLIYVLKNYAGQDVGEFIQDLRYYKAIKVEGDGGVESLNSNLNVDASEKHLDRLKKDIYQFGQCVNMDTDKFGANPSGVSLKFLYSGLDLKCNNFERKLRKAFKDIFWFISEYLKIKREGNFDYTKAKVNFNRNMITNETETIQDCQNSKGMVSDKTIIGHHPWVSDVTEEEQRLLDQYKNSKYNNSNYIDNIMK